MQLTDTSTDPTMPGRKQRLFVFLDGTWNEPASNTNVWRAHSLVVSPVDPDGVRQLCFYEQGMGNQGAADYVLGGFFSLGLDQYVLGAYAWIMQHYRDGDDLFLFGFSRGAYLVRSLIGLIHDCGLLVPGSPLTLDQIYDRYRAIYHQAPAGRYAPRTLKQLKRNPERYTLKDDFVEYNLLRWSRDDIQFRYVGIFDTVGPAGIPIGHMRNISSSTLSWKQIGVPKVIQCGRHALAVDEHRFSFRPTLWSLQADHEKHYADYMKRIEQRWFIGAHCNVGGGYRDDALAQIPLRWILDGAVRCGLHCNYERIFQADLVDEVMASPVRNSLADFVSGLYQWIPLIGRPYYRAIGGSATDLININETVDKSVFVRWRRDPTYRPRNLRLWAERCGLDLDLCPVTSRSAADGSPISDTDAAVQLAVVRRTGPPPGLNHPFMERLPALISKVQHMHMI